MTRPVGRVISAARLRNRVRNYTFPEDIGPHGLLMIFRGYEFQPTRGILRNVPAPTIRSSVLLPLPRQILDNTGIRLSVADLGILGEATATVAQTKDFDAAVAQLARILPSASDVANILSFGPPTASQQSAADTLMAQSNFLLRRMGSGLIDTRALDAGLGNAINPKQALTFQGVNMKEYDFDFEFMPRSPNESDLLRSIGNLIKGNSLPSFGDLVAGDTTIAQRVFLEYPSTVDLYFVGVDASYYFYFKTCMVSRFTMNYAPTGGNQHAILRGGKPAYVTMNISFQEMDIRVRDEYISEGDAP